jgi:hypothetical protein
LYCEPQFGHLNNSAATYSSTDLLPKNRDLPPGPAPAAGSRKNRRAAVTRRILSIGTGWQYRAHCCGGLPDR